MTKPPFSLSKGPSTPLLIIGGAAVLSLALVVGLFIPGGVLDRISGQVEIEAQPTPEAAVEQAMPGLPEALSIANNAAFLAANAKKPGVKVTTSGLQYKVVKPGTGKQPGPTSVVTVHYEGKMIDGTEFDSSIRRGEPAEFPLTRVIAGWTEGLQLMREGEVVEFVIPQELAYASEGKDPIPPYQTLVFQIQLLKVQ
jgi:FKBP-type peptidyl-prolyl cis-trans isomerase